MMLSGSIVITLANWIEVFMQRSMRHFLLFAKQNGLSMTQVATLFMLHKRGICSVSDIGDAMEITSPAASQLLDRLVQQGLVARSEDPNDRRLKRIVLSSAGEQFLQNGIQARKKWLEDLVDLMTPDEQAQVQSALTIMLDKAQQMADEAVPEI